MSLFKAADLWKNIMKKFKSIIIFIASLILISITLPKIIGPLTLSKVPENFELHPIKKIEKYIDSLPNFYVKTNNIGNFNDFGITPQYNRIYDFKETKSGLKFTIKNDFVHPYWHFKNGQYIEIISQNNGESLKISAILSDSLILKNSLIKYDLLSKINEVFISH
jgi:hypothetical protein